MADPQPAATATKPEKIGAGLLFICEGKVLLLKRAMTSGNPGTWGLPGGNADPEDNGDLLTTAKREATEELGTIPQNITILNETLTKRGKNDQKHYTVFLCGLSPEDKAQWEPTIAMNEEHTDKKWMSLSEVTVGNTNLHPVVERLFSLPQHRPLVLEAMSKMS